jgi:type III pantothenate kinase
MILDDSTRTGLNNGYEHPDEVGMDRIANSVGAVYLWGAPALVLDFGTAFTMDYVAAPVKGDPLPTYMGGAILPGIEMAADALALGTARLPSVPLIEPRRVIGRTTIESIQAGLTHGYLGAIQTLVERAREEIGAAVPVYATGGDALNLRDHLPFIQAADPNLTLFGLRQIFGINRDCPLPARADD